MKTSIGGDRLGSGNKQAVHIKNFGRSSHDMGYTFRTSMSAGTLVPFINEIGLPGDSFDINLNAEILTLPTVGPLFGSYKVQMDVFSCPLRLYNRELHMNKLGIGMDMSAVKLPQVRMTAKDNLTSEDYDNNQIEPSSIWSYLGVRGLGREATPTGAEITRDFLAVPYLAYWDVVKQYYSNKQEDEGVVIHAGTGAAIAWNQLSATYQTTPGAQAIDILTGQATATITGNSVITSVVGGGAGTPNWRELIINFSDPSTNEVIFDVFEQKAFTYNESNNTWTATFENYEGTGGGSQKVWKMDNDEAIGGIVSPDGKPRLQRFPLKNIDEMRENILTQSVNGAPYIITQNNAEPYGLSLKQAQVNNETIYSKQFSQEGLACKTYQSDLFNNWISTEWIDGDNGINAVTAVSTADGNFTIDALNIANKVYNMLNRIAISGGTYDDWLDAVYTHERSRSVENPVYMGSLIKQLAFQEVVQTGLSFPAGGGDGPQEANPLGTLAGRGQMTGKNKGGRIKVKVDEPSIIIGLASITPLIDYSQGNKWHMNLRNMNDFHKPSLDAIGYQDLITDQMAWFDTTVGTDGALTYKSAGKQPAWMNYMTNVNVIKGDFAKVNNSMYMVLNRRYEWGENGITDLTTYIDPSKFNHIFADTRLDAQNFWTQIRVGMTARRKMSAKVIPNL